METRKCKIHRNKLCDCFCWTCQALLCNFCMLEHNQYNHKTYSLKESRHSKHKSHIMPDFAKSKQKDMIQNTEPEQTKPVKIEPIVSETSPVVRHRSSSSLINVLENSVKPPNLPAQKSSNLSDNLCLKCGNPVEPKDIQLKCQHWAHTECLRK